MTDQEFHADWESNVRYRNHSLGYELYDETRGRNTEPELRLLFFDSSVFFGNV
jgi:hypothetical protein